MKPIKIYGFLDDRQLEIYPDEDPDNPRSWDNLGVMVCLHGRYNLGDNHEYRSKDFNGWDELEEQIKYNNPGCLIKPLYLYDHSGITISTGPFSCPWDSGQIGFIFITQKSINEVFDGNESRGEQCLIGEVETYDQYLRGDIYRFILRDKPCEKCSGPGEILDNCGGFYGNNTINNGMTDNLKEEYREELKCPKKSNI
jgi:hypothetical protein